MGELGELGWVVEAVAQRSTARLHITDVEAADTEPEALARLLKFDEHFYRLRRAKRLTNGRAGDARTST